MTDATFRNEANSAAETTSTAVRTGSVPANWIAPPRFKGVVLAAALSGIIALGAAGYAEITGSDAPPIPGNGATGIGVSSSACWAAMTLEEMVDSAELIIIGQVMGSSEPYLHAEMFGASPTYYRDMYIRVHHAAKGTPSLSLLERGLVQTSALGAIPDPESAEPGKVVAVRTQVDSYNGIGVSTGMGVVAPDTEALFFIERREGVYHLQRSELGIRQSSADGAYLDDEGSVFTLEDVATLVN